MMAFLMSLMVIAWAQSSLRQCSALPNPIPICPFANNSLGTCDGCWRQLFIMTLLMSMVIILAQSSLGQVAPPRPIPICPFANNSLGTCDGCWRQLFIADNCHKGFICDQQTVDGNVYDGCEISCAMDEILVVDPHPPGSWKCEPNLVNDVSRPLLCPGKFNTECACEGSGPEECPIGDCECAGQLRVNDDCSEAKFCNSATEADAETISCKANTNFPIVTVNLATHNWYCGNDTGRCPGAFHVGCQADPHITTTPDPDIPTTPVPDGSSSSSLVASITLITILPFLASLVIH